MRRPPRYRRGVSLSLCICTYRRAGGLATCLASIADGDERPDQVIVSDDGHEVEAERVATAYPWVTYQRGPARGLSANRNACIDSATGDHIAFIDDDVVVPPTFVSVARSVTGDDVVTGHEVNHDPTPHKVTPPQRRLPRVPARRPER